MRMLEDEKRGLSHHRGGVTRRTARGTRSGVEIEHDDRCGVTHVELRTDGVIGVQAIFQARHLRPHVEALRRVLVSASEPSFSRAISSPSASRNGLRQPHRLPGHPDPT